MKVYSKTYLIKDTHGNKAFGVVQESCKTVQICGMFDEDYQPLYFEADAYHLYDWCQEHNLTMKVIDYIGNFDELWENN